jgi:transketolase
MSAFESAVRTIQFLAADGVEKAKNGHPGTPMALAGITTELFSRTLRYNPKDPEWPNRDRFVLSCGHASMLLYSVLHLAGYDLPKEQLEQFRQWNSLTPGHPEFGHTAGVETTTGPLGQGVGNAVGMALGAKMAGARVNTPDSELINYRVFALASDGDLMEGVASEAASLAGHLGLGNLVVVYDANNITIDGKAELSFSEDVQKRFEAYGWGVWNADGHDPKQVRSALDAAVADSKRPSLIIAKTHIAIGCPTLQDTSKAHGAALGAEEIRGAKAAAGWPTEPSFRIPPDAYTPFVERARAVQPEYDAWHAKIKALSADRKAAWDSFAKRDTSDLLAPLLDGLDASKPEATRISGGKVIQRVAQLVSQVVSGSADLAGSTKTDLKDTHDVAAGSFGGRNFRFGVREHGMGSIANGLSLSGFIPVTSTFLIFSDYMRPPIRLAAMMGLQSVYVFTHDSIYVGEDGPTHQPIEQASSLRLIPGLDVVRPADAAECAFAWAHALARRDAPTAMLLTRQDLPQLERPLGFDPKQMMQGAYILSDADAPTLVLLATGSEVSLAVASKPLLEAKGERVRVVSVPCLELFSRQPKSVQDAVLGTARRVSLEAGATGVWRGWVGLDGVTIGIDRFGASAPAELLAEQFGFTPEAVTKAILG